MVIDPRLFLPTKKLEWISQLLKILKGDRKTDSWQIPSWQETVPGINFQDICALQRNIPGNQ